MFLFVFLTFQFAGEDENFKLKKEKIADFLKQFRGYFLFYKLSEPVFVVL